MRKLKYGYADKVCINVKAQIVGQELTRLVQVNKGALLPETVVRAARPIRSPLHRCFEWDDKRAAHKYRVFQAGYLLRAVVVISEDPDTKEPISCRAFPCIESEGGNYYTTIAHVMCDAELQENIAQQIARNLRYWRQKGHNLMEFERVWKAVDALKV